FPEAFFFVPKHLLVLKGNCLEIISENAEAVMRTIDETILSKQEKTAYFDIKQRFDKKNYLKTVKEIIHEISIGNIYETNFCMEFYAENAEINPLNTYQQLIHRSPTPFSNYFKWFDKYIISAT